MLRQARAKVAWEEMTRAKDPAQAEALTIAARDPEAPTLAPVRRAIPPDRRVRAARAPGVAAGALARAAPSRSGGASGARGGPRPGCSCSGRGVGSGAVACSRGGDRPKT